MAFDVYFRTDGIAPMQQIFLSPQTTNTAIVALLLQSLPAHPSEEGVYKASFIPNGEDGTSGVSLVKVGDVDQRVALFYACKDEQGQAELADIHLDPGIEDIPTTILQTLTTTASKALQDMPDGRGRWVFVAL